MKHLLRIAILTVFFVSCDKYRIPIGRHVQIYVDGKKTIVEACGTSAYYAQFFKDTSMIIGLGCGGEGIGFYLKGKTTDGTYELNRFNIASYYYHESTIPRIYTTNDSHKGQLTISTIIEGNTKYLKGEFEYNAVDTSTTKEIIVTKGTFLLTKMQY